MNILPVKALANEINDYGNPMFFTKSPIVPKTSITAAINILSLLFERNNTYSVLSLSVCSETGGFNKL